MTCNWCEVSEKEKKVFIVSKPILVSLFGG